MARKSVDWDPKEFFQLQDIALWECRLTRNSEYLSAIHDERMQVQTRRGVRAELLEGTLPDGSSTRLLRAIASFALRAIVPPGATSGEASPDLTVLFELDASFAVTYAVTAMPDDEKIEEFARWHCVHNAWPFWRQHVYDTLKRASLPLINVPLFSGRPSTSVKSEAATRRERR
jgi:hypothetical protein